MAGFLSRLFGKPAGPEKAGAETPAASAVPAPRPAPPSPPAPPQPPPPPPFQPANELERLLVAGGGDLDARRAFQAMLLDAPLLVATAHAPAAAGTRTLTEDVSLSIMTLALPDGAQAAALFTSAQRLADCFGTGAPYAAITGRDLLDVIAEGPAILNPGSAYGVRWTSDDLKAMLGRPVRRTLEQDARVLLGVPADPPERLIAALAPLLGADPRIEQAWLALAQWVDRDEQAWYLDIRAQGDPDAIVPGLSAALVDGNLAGRAIDIVVNPGVGDGAGIRLKPTSLH